MNKTLNDLLNNSEFEKAEEYIQNDDVSLKDKIDGIKFLLYSFETQRAKKLFLKYKDEIEKTSYLDFATLYIGIYVELKDEINLNKAKQEILNGPYVDQGVEEFRNRIDDFIMYLKASLVTPKKEDEIDINLTKKKIASNSYEEVLNGLDDAEKILKEGIDLTKYVAQVARKYTKYSLKFYYLITFLLKNNYDDTFSIDKFDIPITFTLSKIKNKFNEISSEISTKISKAKAEAKDVGIFYLFQIAFSFVEAYLIPERIDNIDLNTLMRVTYDIVRGNFEPMEDDPLEVEFPYIDSLYDEYKEFIFEVLKESFFEAATYTKISNFNKASA